ncbi:MAG: RHS repeat-associated core domain-containing protein [Gemmatimonadaceae bacterium]
MVDVVACPRLGASGGCGDVPVPGIESGLYARDDANVTGRTGWFGTLQSGMKTGSGLVYQRNRYVDPATGKFTQADPIGLAGGMNAWGFARGDPVNYADPFGLCPEWLDGKPCNVSFTGLNISAGWLTWAGSMSIGEYGGEGSTGTYFSRSTGAGAGSLPGKTKKSWLPTVSVTIESGGSESLDSFQGASDQVSGSASAGFWTGGGSLSGNSSGKGWTLNGGVSSPGLSASASGQGSNTTLLTKQKIRLPKPETRILPDATAVIQR